MTQSYRIKFHRWAERPQPDSSLRPVDWQPFRLLVFPANGAYQFVFGVSHAEVPTGLGLDELNRQHGEVEIQAAIVRWAVMEVESRLRSDRLPATGTHNVEELELGQTHLPQVEQLALQKTCSYQHSRERELFCSAAAATDETADPSSRLAPTSRPICKACDLPDDEYRCSQLTHPHVIGIRAMVPTGRRLTGAYCEINSPNIRKPSLCHAGGHDCWEYIVEPSGERKRIGFI